MCPEPDHDRQTISVIIAAYNVADSIARAIDSVLAQTLPADEIFIVDDGSTDGTADVIRRYGDKIRYIHQPKTGAPEARNRGIEAATGRWIAFLDADDEWLPDKLARQMDLMRRNPDLVWSYTNMYVHTIGQDSQVLAHSSSAAGAMLAGRDYFDDYLAGFAAGAPTSTITIMIRRDILFEVGLFIPGQRWGEDADLTLRIGYRYPKVGYLTRPLSINHFGRPDSLTARNQTELPMRCDFIRRHLDLSRQAGRQEAFRPCALRLLRRWIFEIGKDPSVNLTLFLDRLPDVLPANLRWRIWLRQFSIFYYWQLFFKFIRQGISIPSKILRKLRSKGYDPRQYWKRRHERFGLNVQGVGNCSLSEVENTKVYQQAMDVVLNYFQQIEFQLPGLRVLDVGCGNGYYTQMCYDQGVEDYTGVDITDTLFNSLRYRFSQYPFIKIDIGSKTLGRVYDCIFMLDVTQHIVDDRKFSFAMNNIRTHLSERGVFLVTSWLSDTRIQKGPHEVARPLDDYRREFPDCVFIKPVAFRDKFLFAIRKNADSIHSGISKP